MRSRSRRFGRLSSHRLDDRAESFVDESLALLARLPDVKDTEDASVVVEARCVDKQAVGSVLEVERGGDRIVVGGARVLHLGGVPNVRLKCLEHPLPRRLN